MFPRALRPLAFAVCLLPSLAPRCAPVDRGPEPISGFLEYQALGHVPVAGGSVNVLGGNLVLARTHLDLDTRVGRLPVGATYNSIAGVWTFSFQMRHDGVRFTDASRAVHDVAGLAPGAAIPGTSWVVVGPRSVKTKGGLVHTFASDGRLETLHWTSAPWPRLVFVGEAVAGGVTRVREIRQERTASSSKLLVRVAYDAQSRVVGIEDHTGRRAEYVRDAAGRLVAARTPGDVAAGRPGERYAYAGGLLTRLTTSDGEEVRYGYADGRLVGVRPQGPGDPITAFAYAPEGDVTRARITDPLGGEHLVDYDDALRPVRLENAAGDVTTLAWDGRRPWAATDPAGVTTYWVVQDDEVVQEFQPSGNIVSYEWEPGAENRTAPRARPLLRAYDLVGPLVERFYDGPGRLVAVTDAAGDTTTLGWDGDGLAFVEDAFGVRTQLRNRGDHGHPRELARAGHEVALSYDAVGNLVEGPAPASAWGTGPGGVVRRRYDADRNLRALVLAELAGVVGTGVEVELELEWRADRQLQAVRRPGGGDTERVYDAFGRLAEVRERAAGVWRTTRYERDLASRATAVERPNGMRVEASYDAAGRRVGMAVLRGGTLESRATLTWQDGRVARVEDSTYGYGPEVFDYDEAGLVEHVVHPTGEELALTRDARGRVVAESLRAADGSDVVALSYTYDGAGRQLEVRADGARVFAQSFTDGKRDAVAYGNGLVRSFAYDGDGLVSSITTRNAAGALVEASSLARDFSGGLFGSQHWHAATSTLGALAFTSHEHYWLASAREGGSEVRAGAYARDADGNALFPYVYDAASNLEEAGFGQEPEHRTFEYGADRVRLERVRRNGSVLRDYVFDEAGFVVERGGEAIEYDGAGRPRRFGDTRLFWDTFGRPTAVAEGSEVTTLRFGGRLEADLAGRPRALWVGPVRLDLVAGANRTHHVDFRGNVKWVSDAAGRAVSHVRYRPFGPDRVQGEPPRRGFAGGFAVGDLVLLGQRLYDPDVGRFLAPDPVFQVVNGYAYTLGDPVQFFDPDGASARTAMAIAVGAGFAGVVGGALLVAVVPVPVAAAVTIASAAYVVGVLVPATPVSMASAKALAGVMLAVPIVRGAGLGFLGGQELQVAILDVEPHPVSQQVETTHMTHHQDLIDQTIDTGGDQPSQVKDLTLMVEDVTPPGCSPDAVALGASPLDRRIPLGLGLLNLLLGFGWAARRRKTRWQSRRS